MAFLTRTSVLDRLCGSLCDATIDADGSGLLLEQLESRNLLVVPLDRHRQWYRYHHLFRDLLHAELLRREPDLVGDLHARAAAWCEANNEPETAIDHARAAGDADLVARLVLDLAQPVWASGRVDTVLRWMEWLEAEGKVERYPDIAVHGALTYALLGRPSEAERWVAVAERGTGDRHPCRRQHDGEPAGVSPRPARPQRRRPDAARRAAELERAQPFQPLSRDDAAHRRSHVSPGGRRRAGRSDTRPRLRRSDSRRRPAVRGGRPRRAGHRRDRARRLA